MRTHCTALSTNSISGAERDCAESSAGFSRRIWSSAPANAAESVAAASETILKSLGSCGVLVNTAAVLRPGALETLSLAEWNGVVSVNLTGYFLCAQVFGRQMRGLGRGVDCLWLFGDDCGR
jgi:NAD(P)-dependent dehydrogenase (short-subunit alcohol dehydrogenase family)